MRLKTRAMHTNTAGSTIWKDAILSMLQLKELQTDNSVKYCNEDHT